MLFLRRLFYVLTMLAVSTSSLLSLAADNELTEEEKQEGYRLLFNGKNLDGFRADPKREFHKWIVKDGVLTLLPVVFPQDKSFTPFPLFTEEEFENFVLKVDFSTGENPENGHSGVILKHQKPKTYEPSSLDVMLFGPARKVGHFSTGAFRYHLSPAMKIATKPAGQWNTLQITYDQGKVEVQLNGEVVNKLDTSQWTKPFERPDGTPHIMPYAVSELPKKSPIGFRDDFGLPIWLKNIKIKPLK